MTLVAKLRLNKVGLFYSYRHLRVVRLTDGDGVELCLVLAFFINLCAVNSTGVELTPLRVVISGGLLLSVMPVLWRGRLVASLTSTEALLSLPPPGFLTM